jgi:hypothetical protein
MIREPFYLDMWQTTAHSRLHPRMHIIVQLALNVRLAHIGCKVTAARSRPDEAQLQAETISCSVCQRRNLVASGRLSNERLQINVARVYITRTNTIQSRQTKRVACQRKSKQISKIL